MKNHLLAAIAVLLVVSCGKNNEKPPEVPPGTEKSFPVSFQVSDFKVSVEDDFSNGRSAKAASTLARGVPVDTLRKYFKYMYYYVNAEGGSFSRTLTQKYTDKNFGVFLDTLPAGRYQMTVAATGFPLPNSGRDTLPAYPLPTLKLPGTDLFYFSVALNVNGPVNENVILKRIVARLKIRITDIMPSSVKEIRLRMYRWPFTDSIDRSKDLYPSNFDVKKGAFDSYTTYPEIIFYKATDSTTELLGFNQEYYIGTSSTDYPDTYKKHMSIYLYVSNGTPNKGKWVYNIPLVTGKTTVVEGTMFTSSTVGDGVGVIVDNPHWRNDTLTVKF